MDIDAVLAASQQAARSLHDLRNAELLSRDSSEDRQRAARESLAKAAGFDGKGKYSHEVDRVLDDAGGSFAADSSEGVEHRLPQGPNHVSSYHAAVSAVRRWLVVLVADASYRVAPDLSESLGLNVSKALAGLERERERLLKSQVDDSRWPRQADVAKRLGKGPVEIQRLCEDGDLATNGKSGRDKRIDPVSILEYVVRKGIVYNLDADDS
jgi:hypothetical protein